MCLFGQIERWVCVFILLMPFTDLNTSIMSFFLLLYDNVGSSNFLKRSSYVRLQILGKHFFNRFSQMWRPDDTIVVISIALFA